MHSYNKYLKLAQDGLVEEGLRLAQSDIVNFEESKKYNLFADALHGTAMILEYYQSKYKESLVFFKKEIQIRTSNNLDGLALAHLRTGIVYMYSKEDDKVLSHMENALHFTTDKKLRGTALNVIGDTIFESDPLKAAQCFFESETLFKNFDDAYNLAHVRLSNARLLGFQKQFDPALRICQEELDKATETKSDGLVGTAELRFAEVYSYMGKFKTASDHAHKAHEVGQNNNWKILCDEAKVFMNEPTKQPIKPTKV
jgi:tetratricopeptide (TPR) repeat protein